MAGEAFIVYGNKMVGLKNLLRTSLNYLFDFITVRRVVVLGDSHVQVFSDRLFRFYFPLTIFDVCSVGGATASGLDNPNSKTDAYSIFKKKINSTPSASPIILMLGEVDTGFVIWYRSLKYAEPVQNMMEKAVQNYLDLIAFIAKKYRLVVISTPLPTISDGNDWGEVANLRKEITVSQFERTKLTLLFNEQVQEYCISKNICYVNLDKESLGEDGLVCNFLLKTDSKDHHYNVEKYAKMIIQRIRPVLRALN